MHRGEGWGQAGVSLCLSLGSEQRARALEHGWFASAVLTITWSLHACFYLSWATPSLRTLCVLPQATHGGLPLWFLYVLVTLLPPKVSFLPEHPTFLVPTAFSFWNVGKDHPFLPELPDLPSLYSSVPFQGREPSACQILAATSPAPWEQARPKLIN